MEITRARNWKPLRSSKAVGEKSSSFQSSLKSCHATTNKHPTTLLCAARCLAPPYKLAHLLKMSPIRTSSA